MTGVQSKSKDIQHDGTKLGQSCIHDEDLYNVYRISNPMVNKTRLVTSMSLIVQWLVKKEHE